MAIIYNKEEVNELDYLDRYTEIVKVSMGSNSPYIRAKETLLASFKDGQLTEVEEAQVLAGFVTKMASEVNAQALESAILLAKDKRNAPYELAKLREDTKLVTANTLSVEATTTKIDKDLELANVAMWKTQSELFRDYGVNTFNYDPKISTVIASTDFADRGTKYESIEQLKAGVYNTYASSYRANDYVTITKDTNGYVSGLTGLDKGLVSAQTNVAIRQEKGFDDNMRQHVVNGSATMLSMLLTTDATVDYSSYLADWTSAVDYLQDKPVI